MEDKQGFFGRILNLIWKRSMSGKKADIINALDNNPEVKQSVNNFAKANQDLQDTIDRIRKEKGKTKK